MSRCDVSSLSPWYARMTVRLAIAILCCSTLMALRPSTTSLQRVRQRGVIDVVAIASDGVDSQKFLEQSFAGEITQLWARHLGVRIHYVWARDTAQALDLLQRHAAQMALTRLPVGDRQLPSLRISRPYMDTQLELVGQGARLPQTNDLSGATLIVRAHSPEAETAALLQEMVPQLHVKRASELARTEDLLLLADQAERRYALVDAMDFDSHHTLHPRLHIVMDLSQGLHLAWAFPGGNNSLYQQAQSFLMQEEKDGSLQRLLAVYGPQPHFDELGAIDFGHDMSERLPRLEPVFKRYAAANHLDWRMLAAIAYQESHWNSSAVSPTGVVGIMMLSASTAADLGVHDRQNAHQSIRAGSDYFRDLVDGLPAQISEPDRTWMALAAYNMGPGHLDDARRLTARLGKNPNLWADVREQLPLLGEPRWYRHLAHGYTPNSRQVLAYVSEVRRYYDTLLLAHPEYDTNTRLALR